ncbi:transmembrane protein EpsG [Paenibacillus eucommiae]|uniref:Transmembrane protein EpsG n=2 Tax=Paenibacillus eucommiae TaxID=1355755 RepID=A0ABS4IS16_9BACL|nr:transmembrane protein EpsG [Paenibacillus eucommiae]
MVLVSGLRKNVGDTTFYMHSYATTEYTWANIAGKKDLGFNIFQMFLQQLSDDPQVLIFVVSLITNVLVFINLYKYSKLFEISIYVYITSGMFLTSMNGVRQFLAAAIIFAATKYIFNGDWKRYMLVVILAAQVHQSALILIPIYFIVRRKAWSWSTTALLSLAILIVIGFNQFSSVLFSVLDSSQYGEYKNFSEGGANILRVVVNGIPILLAYLGRHKLRSLFPKSDYIVNMCLLGFVFMIISTQNWIFARFIFYFGLYIPLLMSWIVHLFVKRERKLIYYSILFFYFIYYFYENVISLMMNYQSDYIKF